MRITIHGFGQLPALQAAFTRRYYSDSATIQDVISDIEKEYGLPPVHHQFRLRYINGVNDDNEKVFNHVTLGRVKDAAMDMYGMYTGLFELVEQKVDNRRNHRRVKSNEIYSRSPSPVYRSRHSMNDKASIVEGNRGYELQYNNDVHLSTRDARKSPLRIPNSMYRGRSRSPVRSPYRQQTPAAPRKNAYSRRRPVSPSAAYY